jgi:polyisoprenoid-binding protein YceI
MVRALVAAFVLTLATAAGALAAPKSQDPTQLPAGDYVLDKRHASLVVKVLHLGFSNYTMRFDGLDGGFTYDPANWTATKATITVDPASIDTGDPGFNKTIAGTSFFDAAKFSQITFVTTQVQGGPDGKGTITGDLTFLGQTRPATLDVLFHGFGPGMMGGGTRLGFSATGRLKRSDFGLTTYSQYVGDDVDLIVEAEFFKK